MESTSYKVAMATRTCWRVWWAVRGRWKWRRSSRSLWTWRKQRRRTGAECESCERSGTIPSPPTPALHDAHIRDSQNQHIMTKRSQDKPPITKYSHDKIPYPHDKLPYDKSSA